MPSLQNFPLATLALTPPNLKMSNSNGFVLEYFNKIPLDYQNSIEKSLETSTFVMSSLYGIQSKVPGVSSGYPSTWEGLRAALNSILSDAMAGIRFSGSEVCGDSDESVDEELCVRWYVGLYLIKCMCKCISNTRNKNHVSGTN